MRMDAHVMPRFQGARRALAMVLAMRINVKALGLPRRLRRMVLGWSLRRQQGQAAPSVRRWNYHKEVILDPSGLSDVQIVESNRHPVMRPRP